MATTMRFNFPHDILGSLWTQAHPIPNLENGPKLVDLHPERTREPLFFPHFLLDVDLHFLVRQRIQPLCQMEFSSIASHKWY